MRFQNGGAYVRPNANKPEFPNTRPFISPSARAPELMNFQSNNTPNRLTDLRSRGKLKDAQSVGVDGSRSYERSAVQAAKCPNVRAYGLSQYSTVGDPLRYRTMRRNGALRRGHDSRCSCVQKHMRPNFRTLYEAQQLFEDVAFMSLGLFVRRDRPIAIHVIVRVSAAQFPPTFVKRRRAPFR